jgi:hypothetical protein
MDFAMKIDPGALVNLPDVKASDMGVHVTDSELAVHFGPEFDTRIDRQSIKGAATMEDPRPAVHLPMGISAAVECLGRGTVAIITSLSGLVRIELDRQVEGMVRPPDYSRGKAPRDAAPVQFDGLILSVQDPQGLVNALSGRVGAAGARSVSQE